MYKQTKIIVVASLITALVCIATMIVKIPSPLKGYINLGDCIVLIAAWILPPMYGFLAAGLGSALADIFSGYIIYAPATFIIKGVMALVAFYLFKLIHNKLGNLPSRIISGVASESIMIVGYLVFESYLYGFIPSLVNVPANCVQGIAGMIISTVLIKIFEKSKILTKFLKA
ncbi:MAG: ECF transporter S component [Ruminococcaceae bacterium]|nr:ECF transporter S component [Oscillospiraceae bacterium]